MSPTLTSAVVLLPLSLIAGASSGDITATLSIGAAIVVILSLTMSRFEPPLLLVPLIYQYLQASTKAWYAGLSGTPLNELQQFDTDLGPAIILASVALSALAVGLRLGAGRPRVRAGSTPFEMPFQTVLLLALALLGAGHVFDVAQFVVPPARQIMLALSGLKWVGLFVLAVHVLRTGEGMVWLVSIAGLEIAIGMTGFFGEFRFVLFVLFGAAVAGMQRIRARHVISVTVVTLFAILLGVFWSHTKVGYRLLLNQGTESQSVLVPLSDRVDYITSAMMTFGAVEFTDGSQRLLDRISYVDYLAVVLQRIPDVLPHENGQRTLNAVSHVLIPRIIYPEKPPLEWDTEVTNYYTGLHENWRPGTSISLGYLAELYIDFGVSGAVIAMALAGFGLGRMYRALRDFRGLPSFINYGVCMMVAVPLATFETALVKIVGSVLMTFAAAFLAQRVLLPYALSWFGRQSLASTTLVGRRGSA